MRRKVGTGPGLISQANWVQLPRSASRSRAQAVPRELISLWGWFDSSYCEMETAWYWIDVHRKYCGGTDFISHSSGCMARGTPYKVECTKCGEIFVVGKHPGRREYFDGTEEEYVKGTILEEANYGCRCDDPVMNV